MDGLKGIVKGAKGKIKGIIGHKGIKN